MSSPLYDETKVMGVKSYENEDFRSIHWSATAKTGTITAKSMSEHNVINTRFISNLQNKSGVSLRNDTEELIELTAGICKQLLMQNCSFEVWINSVKDNGLLHIKNGDNRKHLQNVLRILASISDQDTPISSSYFYTAGFSSKGTGCGSFNYWYFTKEMQ
ncbi:DUF58 domain-containing protein [Bacillus toyonensis]